jgi:hypothetical protein
MPTSHQHGSTRDTYSTAERSRAIIASKAEAIFCQPIQIWGLNVPVSMCPNRVRSLIVSEKKNDIRTGCALRLNHTDKDQANEKGDPMHPGAWRTQLILRDHTSVVIKKYCGIWHH